MVPLSTGGDGAKLEHVDEGFHEGILLSHPEIFNFRM
jgi:hypothetical protein